MSGYCRKSMETLREKGGREHRIQTKKKWDKTISIPVDVLPKDDKSLYYIAFHNLVCQAYLGVVEVGSTRSMARQQGIFLPIG